MYFIKITQDQEVPKIQQEIEDTLINQMWIDRQTRQVEVRFAAYNGNLGLFSVVQAYFDFDLGGEVSSSLDVTVLDLELVRSNNEEDVHPVLYPEGRPYGESQNNVRIALEGCVVIGVIYLALGELKDIWDAKQTLGKYRYYFASVWNFVDLAHIALYLLAIFYWISMFRQAQKIKPPQYFDWSAPEKLAELLDTINKIMEQADLFGGYIMFNVMNLFVILFLIFKFTRFQGRLAVVNNTLKYSMENLFHFFIIFLATLAMYTVMSYIIFGRYMEDFSTIRNAFDSNWLGAVNTFELGDLQAVNPIFGTLFYYSNTLFVFFVLINFFLAIVMEAYDEANGEASEATSVLSDMAGFIEEYKDRILCRHKVEVALETNEDGSHEFEMDLLLDERVIGVLQQIRYAAGMKVADAGMLRKAIIERFAEEREEGEGENHGEEIANALIVWYFEDVDPGAAPEDEDDDVGGKVDALEEKLVGVEQKIDKLLEKVGA